MATAACFTTAFDAAGQPPDLFLPGVALVTIVAAYLVLVFCTPYWGVGSYLRRRGAVIAAIVIAAAVLVLDVVSTNQDWWNEQFGTAHVAEGDVEAGASGSEWFVVDGIRFQHSDSDGGQVRAGLHVQLDSGPTITKLELACKGG
jgi:hypothetical protein